MKLYTSFLCLVGFLTCQSHVLQALRYPWPKPRCPIRQKTPAEWVRLHNLARSKVGVGPLKWNTTVANYSKNYSEQRSDDCVLVHSQALDYGENLYLGPGQGQGVLDAAAAMKGWVGEIDSYDYNSNTCEFGKQCGHYTQVVWNETTQLGCGIAKCDNAKNMVYITCRYYPPGLQRRKTLLIYNLVRLSILQCNYPRNYTKEPKEDCLYSMRISL